MGMECSLVAMSVMLTYLLGEIIPPWHRYVVTLSHDHCSFFPPQDELLASQHNDDNSVACIEEKCYVLGTTQYCRYASLSDPAIGIIRPGVGCRRIPSHLKNGNGTVAPLRAQWLLSKDRYRIFLECNGIAGRGCCTQNSKLKYNINSGLERLSLHATDHCSLRACFEKLRSLGHRFLVMMRMYIFLPVATSYALFWWVYLKLGGASMLVNVYIWAGFWFSLDVALFTRYQAYIQSKRENKTSRPSGVVARTFCTPQRSWSTGFPELSQPGLELSKPVEPGLVYLCQRGYNHCAAKLVSKSGPR